MKRTIITIMMAIIGFSSMAAPFNEGWTFWSDGDEKRVQVTLPHDAMIHQNRSKDTPGGNAVGYFPGGVFHYEKAFDVPSEWLSKNVVLRFEGVYKDAKVFLNDVLVGGYPNGYAQFDVCLDGGLKEGENIVRVDTDNASGLDSRYYSGAGIYRPVHLLVREKDHIESVRVTTLSVTPPSIHVEATLTGGDPKIEILDGNEVIAEGKSPVKDFTLDGAKLWSEHDPYLYTVKVSLENGEVLTDTFGIRTLEWDRNGFRVNGETVLLKGGCIHSDNGILGMAEYDEAADRRIRILKSFGFNAIRSSHNPCSEAILKACDKYGVYVMDELWDMWFKAKNPNDYSLHFKDHFLTDIEKMVEKDYNHPSVVMYSIGNEISEYFAPGGLETEKALIKAVKENDPTRAVTVGLNVEIAKSAHPAETPKKERSSQGGGGMNMSTMLTGGGLDSQKWNEMMHMMGISRNNPVLTPEMEEALSSVVDPLDIVGYNYGSGRYHIEAEQHPDRVVVGSETFPTTIYGNWELVRKYPNIIGDFLWTAWDYIGETGLGAWSYTEEGGFFKSYPWIYSGAGVIDVTGEPTAEAFQAKTVFDKEDMRPYICVRPITGKEPRVSVWRSSDGTRSWNWSGCEGMTATVEVFTNSPTVKLKLGRRTIGVKDTEEGVATFILPYGKGKLTAISYNGKKRTGKDVLRSGKGELAVRVSSEENEISPGEIVFLDIDLVSGNGERVMTKDRDVTITVEGGELLAFGSASQNDTGNFDDRTSPTHYGHALAVVRAEKGGTLSVTATCEGATKGRFSSAIKQ